MGAFAPTPQPPEQEAAQPQPPGQPMNSFAPEQGFEGGSAAGTPPADPTQGVAEQNEGMFSTFQEIEAGIRGTTEFLTMLSGQFPGAAEPIRKVLEAMQAAEGGLMDIIQAVTVEASQPTPAAPRSAF